MKEKVQFALISDFLLKVKFATIFVLLDVRTKEEYKKKRVSGARCFPLEELESKIKELLAIKEARNPLFFIHCDQNHYPFMYGGYDLLPETRSMKAWKILKSYGIDSCVLDGNTEELIKRGIFYYEEINKEKEEQEEKKEKSS